MNKSIESVLKLEKLVFYRINFTRTGFKTENELEMKIQSNISKLEDIEFYKSTLILNGTKPGEYKFEIMLSGYFSFTTNENISDKTKYDLLNKNSIAILMPYLRSEVSVLTAQPETDVVVLPVFNINNMLKESKNS